jgi:DMSO reductase family type II enzyme heme b subunit
MNKRSLLSLSLILAAAAGLTFFKVPLAGSQGLTLVAAQVSGDLPLADPDSGVWQQATAIEVPLSAQNVARPMLLNTNVKSITARALHNGTQLAILVEWADETQNDSMVRVQDFRDAAAVQFAFAEAAPFFCMGQQGGNVNIWHWKADWQADITARMDTQALYPNMYVDQYPFTSAAEPVLAMPADYTDLNYLPALVSGNLFASATRASPVEDLIAGGFGSLTAEPADGQNVQGFGAWADGKWQVIFSRDLVSAEADDVTFTAGKVYSMAFAAWDGANDERNGQKSTSQWVSLQIEGAVARPVAAQPASSAANIQGIWWAVIPMMMMAGLIFGLVAMIFLISKLPDKK